MKRVVSSAVVSTTTVTASFGTKATPVALQGVQRPDIQFETHGANLTDLSQPANSFHSNMFSKYRPSAPPADLQNTPVDQGLGTSQNDPYTRTLPNIPTIADGTYSPARGVTGVSFSQGGPVSLVTSPNSFAVAASHAALSASAPANLAKSRTIGSNNNSLSMEEIAALEKGTFTLTEWIGMNAAASAAFTPTTAAPNSAAAIEEKNAFMMRHNNGLLKLYVENFLQIEVAMPVSDAALATVSHFESKGIAEMCLATGRGDTSVVTEQWKNIAKKFSAFANSGNNNSSSMVVEKNLLNPERFLSQLDAVQREALLFINSLTADAATPPSSTATSEELSKTAPEEAVRVIKILISGAIEARNKLIQNELLPIITNSVFLDEGSAVWRTLLKTFDAEKRQIFVGKKTKKTDAAGGADEDVDPLADSPQLAAYDWIMSHDRPLPKVTAPVAMLFLLSAIRASTNYTTTATSNKNAASSSASSAFVSTTTLDEAMRAADGSDKKVTVMNTLAHFPNISDDLEAEYVCYELEKLFGAKLFPASLTMSTSAVDASKKNKFAVAAARNQQNNTKANNKTVDNSAAAAVDGKKFLAQLRLAGFDVDILQQVELMMVSANESRTAEAQQHKTVVGANDVGATTTTTAAAAGEQSGNNADAANNTNSNAKQQQVVLATNNISQATRTQIAPIVTLFQNSAKGASALFQQLYKDLTNKEPNAQQNAAGSTEVLIATARALGFGTKFENITTVLNSNNPKFAAFWAINGTAYAEALLTSENIRILAATVATLKKILGGNAQLSEGIVSKEGLKLLDGRLQVVMQEAAEARERTFGIRKVLTARHNVQRVVECLGNAGADVTLLLNFASSSSSPAIADTVSSPSALSSALLNDASLVQQVGSAVIARHPHWAHSGVIPSDPAHFNRDNIIAIAAHVFVRLSYVPHTTLAVMKRNYRGRIGEVFIPESGAAAAGDNALAIASAAAPQPRHHNLPIEVGKVESFDTTRFKTNDPQGWYQRMRDIHNRNISIKIDIKDLRTISDDFSAASLGKGGSGEFASTASSSAASSSEDVDSSSASSSAYNTNGLEGKQVYFGLQSERRLRVLAGDRVGMDVIKLDSDRYEDQPDNEKYGLVKLQQLLSDAKKTELGKIYWPSVEVKVRNPSGQSRSMQSLIDYNRIEEASKDLYAQYREIKKKALFVSPMDLYLKDRSEAAQITNNAAKTSVTSEGYVVGAE